jgi:hypothetical protein
MLANGRRVRQGDEVENPVDELPTAITRYRYYHGGLSLQGKNVSRLLPASFDKAKSDKATAKTRLEAEKSANRARHDFGTERQ